MPAQQSPGAVDERPGQRKTHEALAESAIPGLAAERREPGDVTGLSDALDAGLLEPVLTRFQWLDLTAYVVYPETRYLAGRVRALVDFLAARWADAPD